MAKTRLGPRPNGSARFERLGEREFGRVIDTTAMREGDDIHGIGVAGHGGVLVTYHVTDDPAPVVALIRRRGRLIAAYGAKGRSAELGPGLYVTGAPEYWVGRARGKWDFLKRLTPAEVHKLTDALRVQVEDMRTRRWLSSNEYDYAIRDMKYVDEGHYDASALTRMAEQPYNIKFWEPEYLKRLGIQPGRMPRLLELRVSGPFAELTRSRPNATLLRSLRRGGILGAFTRASMATNPEMVIWETKAIVGVREVPFR